ncbi:hypothetical protein FRB90_012653 [Tulasnella sp. 427]|nr:hypothetical protein FRB90_012653 [Tulasnella sp. 427]
MDLLDDCIAEKAFKSLLGSFGIEIPSQASPVHLEDLEKQENSVKSVLEIIQEQDKGHECSVSGPPHDLPIQRAVNMIVGSLPGSQLKKPSGLPSEAAGEAHAMSLLRKEAERTIALLRHRQNTLLPVAHLPPEVLVQIFHDSLEDTWRDISALQRSLLLVCRDWTTVVEGTASLWSRIDLIRSNAGLRYLVISLERSKTQLLDIDYHCQYSKGIRPDVLVQKICKHMDRWRCVRLTLEGTVEDLSLFSSTPPLQLETFKWVTMIGIGDPLPFFNEKPLPMLQDIHLELCQIDWTAKASSFKNLRNLDLIRIYPGPSTLQLLLILHQSPSLESLQIDRVEFQSESSCQDTLPPTICLHKLNRLFIWTPPTFMSGILSRIQIPNCRSFRLYSRVPGDDWSTFVTEALEPHLSVMQSLSKNVMDVALTWINGALIVMANRSIIAPSVLTALELKFGIGVNRMPDVLDWVALDMGLEAAQVPFRLALSSDQLEWTDAVSSTLSRFKGVTSLELLEPSNTQLRLVSWLAQPLSIPSDKGEKATFPFPRLTAVQGLNSGIAGSVIKMIQTRNGLNPLPSSISMELPVRLEIVQIRESASRKLDRGSGRLLEEAMCGGEVIIS